MSKTKSALAVATAILSMLVFAQVASAQSCGCAQATPAFGYPAGGGGCNGSCGRVGGRGPSGACINEFKARMAHFQANSEKVSARNAAWPKPFACADAQLWHDWWRPMINTGFEDQNLLESHHFDRETGELTKYGKQQVAGIMQNMPTHRKVVFIQRTSDEATTMARFNKVKEVVDTWYGSAGSVQLSNRNPIGGEGTRAEGITNSYYESAPVPVIPIATGADSVGDAVGN